MKVAISQYRLLHYRTRLFEQLRTNLASHGHELYLIHGQATRRESAKNDTATIPWAHVVKNKYIEIGNTDIVWQPYPKHLDKPDLIILMQENRLLSNYPWLYKLRGKKTKVAFWGHGKNFQSNSPKGIFEQWKKIHINLPDWWFAYTEETKEIVISSNYPSEKITVLNNTIDTISFTEALNSITKDQITEFNQLHKIPNNAIVGLFCGSLYKEKRLDFLIESSIIIKKHLPNFELVILGDGPLMPWLQSAAAKYKWIHILGATKGLSKAIAYKRSAAILNPGLVGLHVIDAFCAGIPIITTQDAKHSPEIAYLEHMLNGLIIQGGTSEYAEATIQAITDNGMYLRLTSNALQASKKYTIEEMASNFTQGIEQCLNQ